MKLHLGSIGDYAQTSIIVDHIDPARPLTTKYLSKKKEHNQAMLEISSALSYVDFDDIKSVDSANKIWYPLHTIYGGDKNF